MEISLEIQSWPAKPYFLPIKRHHIKSDRTNELEILNWPAISKRFLLPHAEIPRSPELRKPGIWNEQFCKMVCVPCSQYITTRYSTPCMDHCFEDDWGFHVCLALVMATGEVELPMQNRNF